jgi:PAS domain S-box-containing protein
MLTASDNKDIFEAFFAAAPDALFLIDEHGRIEEANIQAEKLFGYRRDELIGETVELLLPDESRTVHVGHRDSYVRSPTVRKMGSELELFGRTKQGRKFPIDVSLSPIEREDRKLIAAAVRDFTAQKQIEAALREAKEDAQSATDSKSRFLAAASHDLRQPLQSLTLYLAVLKRQSADPGLQETADKMRAALDNMGELLNALLDLSRFEGGSITPDIEDVRVETLLSQIKADNAPIAEQKQLELDVTESNAVIRSDPRLLERIVENFVTNAIKYTDSGKVVVRCKPDGDELAIEIADTGIGIEPSHLESIFDEYMQIDNASRDRRKGLGLGLTIAKNIARLLNHEILVRSEPGNGSVFTVKVPLVRGSSVTTSHSIERSEPAMHEGLSIALIEDDKDVLDATRMLLESIGNEVAAFEDAERLLENLSVLERPDLIVSDYRLPGADGLQLIRRVREHYGSEIPAIVMTGDTTLPELADTTHPGCAVLFKPIDTEQLIDYVAASQRGS